LIFLSDIGEDCTEASGCRLLPPFSITRVRTAEPAGEVVSPPMMAPAQGSGATAGGKAVDSTNKRLTRLAASPEPQPHRVCKSQR